MELTNKSTDENNQIDLFRLSVSESLKAILKSGSGDLLIRLNYNHQHADVKEFVSSEQADGQKDLEENDVVSEYLQSSLSQCSSNQECSDRVILRTSNYSYQKQLQSKAKLPGSLKLLACSVDEWDSIYLTPVIADLVRQGLLKTESRINTNAGLILSIFDELIRQSISLNFSVDVVILPPTNASQIGNFILADHTLRLSPNDARGLAERDIHEFNAVVENIVKALPINNLKRTALYAGIYLWHGMLEESHQYAQSIEGVGTPKTGDYWHAIMHRMEPDYFNAKYWNRRVGKHPVHDMLYSILASDEICHSDFFDNTDAKRLISAGAWQADVMVDLVAQAVKTQDMKLTNKLRQIQQLELLLLLIESAS